jgi:peptide/nickel transport system substrate-binding protein
MNLPKALLAAGFLLIASLVPGSAAAQTLRIGLGDDPGVLDPALSRLYVGGVVIAALCERLVDISPELDIVPQLATEWQWTDGNKGLVMKLRPGVKFQDGEVFDAAAVKFNIERYLTLPGSNRKAEISAVSEVQIIDDHTVKLVLSAPFAPLLSQLANWAGMMVSPKAAREAGENFGAHPVCAGPFKFVERVAQGRIVLERFADYWNKDAIHFDRIVFLPIPDSTVRLANLKSGALDLTLMAATDLVETKLDRRVKLADSAGLGYQGIYINLNNGPRAKNPLGQDARVREALELSIDRAALNDVVFDGEFQPGNQWVAPGNPYYIKSFPVPGRDLARAKQLLAEANAPSPTVELMALAAPVALQAAQVIQAMAGEAGFAIKIRATEMAAFIDLQVKGEYEAQLWGWNGKVDPDGNIYNLLSCKAPPAYNTAHYCNPEVDRELDAARLVEAPAERLQHYAKAAERVLADRPIIYLYHGKYLYAMNPKLAGFTPYPDGLIRLQGMRME